MTLRLGLPNQGQDFLKWETPGRLFKSVTHCYVLILLLVVRFGMPPA